MDEKQPGAGKRGKNVVVVLAFVELRRPETIRQAAMALHDAYSDAAIVACNTEATRAIEDMVPEVDRWVTLPGGIGMGLSSLRPLKRTKPAAVCIHYQSPAPHAHLKLEMMAAYIGGGTLYQTLDSDPSLLVPLSRTMLWLRVMGKIGLAMGRAVVAGLLTLCAGIVFVVADVFIRHNQSRVPVIGKRRES
jgi:hypothetical protein